MLLAAIRRDLLHADSSTAAIDLTLAHVRREIGPAIVLPDGDGPEAERGWLTASGIEHAWTIHLRDRSSGERLGRMLVARVAGASDLDDRLRAISEDLAAALSRLRVVQSLREEIARQQQLVETAGEALTRDAREVVRALSELERRDAATKAELHQALRFQRAMLPPLPRLDRFTCEALYLPADVISGDFYDVTQIAPDRVRIFIADATGHGVAAGLATMFIKSEYEAQKRTQQEPAQVLASMNDLLVSSYGTLELRFTASCIDVDLPSGALTYSTAAHPGALIARSTGTTTLATGGSFVGVADGVSYPTFEATLEPGDIALCFTDGLTDASSADGSMFGEGRIADVLDAARRERQSASGRLVRALAGFVGRGRRLADDVAAIFFGVTER